MKLKINKGLPFLLTLGMPLRIRIALGTLVPILAVVFYFTEIFRSQREFSNLTHQILDVRIEMMHSAATIKQALVSYDDALFRFLGIQESLQLREGERYRRIVEEEIGRLKTLSESPTLTSRLNHLESESRQYFVDAGQLLSYARDHQMQVTEMHRRSQTWVRRTKEEHLELAFLSEEGHSRLIRVFALCDEIITANRIALEEAQKEMNAQIGRTRTRAILFSVLVVGVLLVVMAGFAVSVLYPLGALMDGVRQIEQGSLDVQIPVITKDEVGELSESFNRATRTIRDQREQLLRESITDHLTGAYNQRHFRKILAQEMERAKRAGSALTLLMVDIDHFKSFNDNHGHEFGNEVIRHIVSIVRHTLRQTDLVARYGGDELALLLPETGLEEAQTFARRLLEGVAEAKFPMPLQETAPRITISIGGACYPKDAGGAEELIHRADEALYAAKRGGRSRAHWTGASDPIIVL